MNYISIFLFEWKHLWHTPFKLIAIALYLFAAAYSLHFGHTLRNKQLSVLADLEQKQEEKITKVLQWYAEGKTGPDDRPWMDIRTPFWANWSAPVMSTKVPSDLLPFAVGQAEQYGFYKEINNWATPFDSDLAEEIANPERLSLGTLDFSFVLLYLTPLLILILLFNVGGLEKDLGFVSLIKINTTNHKGWIALRFTFYFIVTASVLLLIQLIFAAITRVHVQRPDFLAFLGLGIMYVLAWFILYFIFSLYQNNSSQQALLMISIWILLCLVLPGATHQWVILKHPTHYMTEFIDANRTEMDKIWELSPDSMRRRVLEVHPELKKTQHGRETTPDEMVVQYSASALSNAIMQRTTQHIERRQEAKNQLVKNLYWINPVNWFQNQLNALAATDYYAYRSFREDIQAQTTLKISVLVRDVWNRESIDEEKYRNYLKTFKTKAP